MPVTISDDVLKQANLSERDALIEIACRLFDADKLTKTQASRLAGLSRIDFEAELVRRGLPVIHIDDEYWEQELKSLQRIDRDRPEGP
jgi:predicted HTH domain antitoxin